MKNDSSDFEQAIAGLIVLLFVLSICFFAAYQRAYGEETLPCKAVLHCRANCGMFSLWMDVLSLCNEYEKGKIVGIEVDFKDEGLYYDKNYGENWWTYYCEPISLGTNIQTFEFYGDPPGALGNIENRISRQYAKYLIDKYIHVKPEIMHEVNEFVDKNFKGKFVFTVHFRGTDKYTEAPRVKWKSISNRIFKLVKMFRLSDYKIFIATDEKGFIDYMEKTFFGKVCYTNCERIDGLLGVHYLSENKYQIGKEALIDMILLSRGNILIRTSSNLSRWSTWMNPDIRVDELKN